MVVVRSSSPQLQTAGCRRGLGIRFSISEIATKLAGADCHSQQYNLYRTSCLCAMAEHLAASSSSKPRMPPPFNPNGMGPKKNSSTKKQLKAPAELIAHYTSKGMDEKAASEKVITDLQKALAFSFESYPMQKMMMMDKVVKTNVESFNQRLSVIEAKVDSKPNLPAVFGVGVAAGGLLKLAWEGVPHALQAVAQVTKDARVSNSASRV